MRCSVVALEDLTHDIKRVCLRIDAGGPFSFTAGQYAKVEFLPLTTRDYSMANVPGDEPGLLEFHVRAVPGGAASAYVHAGLQPGHTVRVSGPYGASYLREQHTGPVLAIAGGSGLAPIISIVGRALALDHARPIHLYFGARSLRDVYHEDLLRAWAAKHPHFRYTIALSDEQAAGYAHGRVADIALARLQSIEGLKAYLAGPPPMVEAATRMLDEKGVAARDIHADAFYTTADRAASGADQHA
jgi:CDP-4-dehydro-6-deoxyglucose reductase/ferredoxin-NAD(P)+ reductase (naphthalene dioxygenase ferredoxin-specific)